MMKKVISIILCVAILVSCCGVFSFAEQSEDYPLIIVPGFLQPYMFIEGEDGEEDEYLWLMSIETLLSRLVSDLPTLLPAALGLAFGKTEEFGAAIGKTLTALADKLRCNPDGSSVYPVTHYKNDPAWSNAEYLSKNVSRDAERKNFLFEKFVNYAVSNGYTKAEDVFIFEFDSRHDAIQIAEELRTFIKEVKEYKNCDKVNLLTISYGGLITATYLYSYMEECDVNKAVLNVPPLQGTDFIDRLFRKNVDLPMRSLADFVESVLGASTEIADIFANIDPKAIVSVFEGAVDGMLEIVQNWSSMYTITSPDLYDELKKDFLDADKAAEMIERNDIIHYEIMPSMTEIFEKCKALGTDVSIVACTGVDMVFGGELNGDLLVPVYSASGAEVAKLGERFADGYTGKKTACDNPAHNHISPSMEIDATSAFLPENTWFIEDSYHAQFELENYASSLFAKLVFTDELKDVYSDPDYPQFENSDNPHMGLHISFDSSNTGYLSSDDKSVVIRNVFDDTTVKILSVVANGVDISFDCSGVKTIAPGESIEIPFAGDVPEISAKRGELTVNYVKTGSIPGMTSKIFEFTVNNGVPCEYSGGTVENRFESMLEATVPESLFNVLVRLCMRKMVECVFDTLKVA